MTKFTVCTINQKGSESVVEIDAHEARNDGGTLVFIGDAPDKAQLAAFAPGYWRWYARGDAPRVAK
jgi:hypothetical protein